MGPVGWTQRSLQPSRSFYTRWLLRLIKLASPALPPTVAGVLAIWVTCDLSGGSWSVAARWWLMKQESIGFVFALPGLLQ